MQPSGLVSRERALSGRTWTAFAEALPPASTQAAQLTHSCRRAAAVFVGWAGFLVTPPITRAGC